ncbi:MAG: zinc ABC transporter substrate-binding protein [Cocleimonas sp.]|nr:zinc ABC transporter substrate-binding protein [Cocleimonas sp.]
MHRIVLYFLMLGIISVFSSVVSAEPYKRKIKVLSSIKPIQSIVLAIAGEHVISQQLIPDYASPHTYAFKPSDMRKIKKADIIFRIDDHFEAMLNPLFANVADQSKIISLADKPEIHFLPATGGHSHADKNDNAAKKEHDSEHKENMDMHIFTSPKNVLLMARTIADSLSQREPNKKGLYEKNLKAFSQAVNQKAEDIKQDFNDINTTPYFVFHNSWQYFGEYFGLQKPEVLNVHEGITAGVKTILESRREIIADNVHCIFSDPSISDARAKTLTENLDVKTKKIDILQSGLALDGFTYLNWLDAMRVDVKACLSYGM